MKKVFLFVVAGVFMGISAQASELCSSQHKMDIELKDQATIQRVAKQFEQTSRAHEQGLVEVRQAMQAEGFSSSQEFMQAYAKGSKPEYVQILKMAARNSAMANQIQELRPCLHLAGKILGIKVD